MLRNDTLQKHQDCMKQCEIKHAACKITDEDEEKCDTEIQICEQECDFDYGP